MNTSYNGWAASPDPHTIGIVPLDILIDGHTYSFPGGCKGGDAQTIFSDFLPKYHRLVEPLGLGGADEWGYSYRQNRNADNLSCHASGTAVDVNSRRHPNGARRTLTALQVAHLRKLLTFYEGVLKWGGEFTGTPDEMHYELHGTGADIHRIALKIRNQHPQEEPVTDDDVRKIAEAVKALLLREAQFLAGKENSVFNEGTVGVPAPKQAT